MFWQPHYTSQFFNRTWAWNTSFGHNTLKQWKRKFELPVSSTSWLSILNILKHAAALPLTIFSWSLLIVTLDSKFQQTDCKWHSTDNWLRWGLRWIEWDKDDEVGLRKQTVSDSNFWTKLLLVLQISLKRWTCCSTSHSQILNCFHHSSPTNDRVQISRFCSPKHYVWNWELDYRTGIWSLRF